MFLRSGNYLFLLLGDINLFIDLSFCSYLIRSFRLRIRLLSSEEYELVLLLGENRGTVEMVGLEGKDELRNLS